MKSNKETEDWYIDKLVEGIYTLTEEGELVSRRLKRPLKKELIRSGYHRWRTQSKEGAKYILVHRLMYLWFIGRLSETDQVNHIDNDRLNNDIKNIEISNNSHNQIHRVLTSSHNTRKLDKDKVVRIYKLHSAGKLDSSTRKELCKEYDIVPSVISNIIHGKNWSYITEEL